MIGVFAPDPQDPGHKAFKWTNRERLRKTRERSFAELRKNRDARSKSYSQAKARGQALVSKGKKASK